MGRLKVNSNSSSRSRSKHLATVAMLLLTASAANAVVVDDFTTEQGPVSANTSSSVAGGGLLGGGRDIGITRTAGSGTVTALVALPGTLAVDIAAATDGEILVQYDGTDSDINLDIMGLGAFGQDLTADGRSAFTFVVDSATAGMTLTMRAHTAFEGSASSSFMVTLPQIVQPTVYNLPYSLFLADAGVPAVDFSAVGAIEMILAGSGLASATLSGPLQTAVAAPSISATKEDLDDFTSAGGTAIGSTDVNPGDRITYRVTVRNTGDGATAVTLSDLLDPNLEQVLPADVRITPILFPDTYADHCGNTTLNVDGAAGFEGLLNNDLDADDSPAGNTNLTITQIQGVAIGSPPFTTDQGGSISSVNASTGTFNYEPVAGFSGLDSFTYTVQDDEGQTASSQAFIAVSGLVWFVDHDHGGTNVGTLANPFTDFSQINGAGGLGDLDDEGHIIFVKDDGGGDYTGGFVLERDQRLIGEIHGLSECVRTAITDDGTGDGRPDIVNAAGDGLIVTEGNTIRGVNIGAVPAANAKISDSAAGLDTLIISNTTLSGAGAALNLDSSGDLDATFNSIESTSSTGPAIFIDGIGGSLTVTNGAGTDTSIAGAATGIDVRNAPVGSSFDFAETNINSTGTGVNLASNSTAAVTFADLDATTTAGPGIVASAGGTVNLAGVGSSITAVGGPALDLTNTDLGAGWTFTTVSSSGSGSEGIDLDGINDPIAVTGAGSSITAANAANAVDINGGSANFSYAGTVGQTGTGRTVSVANRTGGTHTFSGNVTGTTGGGVTLTSNTGAQVDFTGGLNLQTGNATAFQATGGGTVNVTSAGTTNLAVNAAPHALDLNGISIGANDITFDAITATATTSEAIDIDGVTNAGTFFGGVVDVNGTSAGVNGIDINGSSAAFNFTSAEIDTTGGNGINLNGANGIVTFTTVDVDGTTGSGLAMAANSNAVNVNGGTVGASTDAGNASNPAVDVAGGAGAITIAATVTNSNGRAVEVTGRSGGTVTMNGAVNETGTGLNLANNNAGAPTVDFNGQVTANTGTTTAVTVSGNTGGTVRFDGGLNVDTTTSDGMALTGGGTVHITGGTNTVDATSGGNGVLLNGIALTLAGGGLDVTTTAGSGNGVDVTGGTVTISGTELDIASSSGTGFRAISGGTVQVTGTGHDVSSTTGSVVNISDTTIGASHATFESIATTTASSTTALILDDTGAGQFRVTGVGSTAGSGGTLSNKTVDAVRFNTLGGQVRLANMIIQDISSGSDAGDVIGTRSGVDGIHGQSVNGGLVLDNVTMRRFSDNAINGASLADGLTPTNWNGLEIRNSLIEDSNRYHVGVGAGGRGDDNLEGMVRITGLTGIVVIDNSTFRRGAQLLDLATSTSAGNLDMTVQRNNFSETVKEFLCNPPGTVNVGKACMRLEGGGAANSVVRIGDPAELNSALGNTFTDCGTASLRLAQNVGSSGNFAAVIAHNDFIVNDHLTGPSGCPGGSFQFNFPQGGVLLDTGSSGSYEAIVSNNLFDEVFHAAGLEGQLTISMDDPGTSEFIVRGNDFRLPWDAGVRLRADGNSSSAVLVDGNTYTDGSVGGPSDDVGFATPSPFNPFLVNVRNGGSMDLTIRNEVLHQHDDVSSAFSESFDSSINASGGTLNLSITDTASPDGYNLERNGGTFNLFNEQNVAACPRTAAQILDDNTNTGGGNNDLTDPPFVATTGTINCVTVAPTLPAITIP